MLRTKRRSLRSSTIAAAAAVAASMKFIAISLSGRIFYSKKDPSLSSPNSLV